MNTTLDNLQALDVEYAEAEVREAQRSTTEIQADRHKARAVAKKQQTDAARHLANTHERASAGLADEVAKFKEYLASRIEMNALRAECLRAERDARLAGVINYRTFSSVEATYYLSQEFRGLSQQARSAIGERLI